MGYDSRLYIVDKHESLVNIPVVIDGEDYGVRKYGEVIGRIEMGKCPVVQNFMKDMPETDCYIYADDGNTQIVVDRYDKVMTECPINELLTIVEQAVYEGDTYRRLTALLSFLKGFKEDNWDDIVVLHYGH